MLMPFSNRFILLLQKFQYRNLCTPLSHPSLISSKSLWSISNCEYSLYRTNNKSTVLLADRARYFHGRRKEVWRPLSSMVEKILQPFQNVSTIGFFNLDSIAQETN
jgi:hypothetical protein